MDAFCHGIESYWAKNATAMSREYARQAIILCRDNIANYVNSNDIEAAKNMILASNLAGKAINISRTTASHAISYKMTSEYGIPHGHAVALTIPQLFEFNTRNGRYRELKELISDNTIEYFERLYNEIGLEHDFKNLGISDIKLIAENVNMERLSNNPIELSKNDIYKLLEPSWKLQTITI